MMKLLSALLLGTSAFAAFFNPSHIPHVVNDHGTCTISASGQDDSPALLAAVHVGSCNTIVIPTHTTLNISRKLDMTGLRNKHIVSSPARLLLRRNKRSNTSQNLKGVIKFNPDITYWTAVSSVTREIPVLLLIVRMWPPTERIPNHIP